MSDTVWPYWKIAAEPDAGVYKLVMFAGLHTSNPNIQPDDCALYVCKSLNGFLNVAFSYKEIMNRKFVQCRKNGDLV